jgi:hypothetical protein
MDDNGTLTRLERIGALDRDGAHPGELLAELRGLLREAERAARARPATSAAREEVVERLGTAPHGT